MSRSFVWRSQRRSIHNELPAPDHRFGGIGQRDRSSLDISIHAIFIAIGSGVPDRRETNGAHANDCVATFVFAAGLQSHRSDISCDASAIAGIGRFQCIPVDVATNARSKPFDGLDFAAVRFACAPVFAEHIAGRQCKQRRKSRHSVHIFAVASGTAYPTQLADVGRGHYV